MLVLSTTYSSSVPMKNILKPLPLEENLPKILWLEDDKLYVSLLREDFEQKYHLDNISFLRMILSKIFKLNLGCTLKIK